MRLNQNKDKKKKKIVKIRRRVRKMTFLSLSPAKIDLELRTYLVVYVTIFCPIHRGLDLLQMDSSKVDMLFFF